jgi:hypothetical protein
VVPAGGRRWRLVSRGREYLVLTETQDNEQIIERVAAIDIGKAELICCIRFPMRTSRVNACRRSTPTRR